MTLLTDDVSLPIEQSMFISSTWSLTECYLVNPEHEHTSYDLCFSHVQRLQVNWKLIFSLSSQVRNGHIKRITDDDIQSLVVEILGTNVR